MPTLHAVPSYDAGSILPPVKAGLPTLHAVPSYDAGSISPPEKAHFGSLMVNKLYIN